MEDARATGISPAGIRSALEDILQSETFARSERSRDLLRYIVETDLEGDADRLKGFAIALDVFDREDNFDPSTDAVVRVQAGRLRDLLDSYYAGEGAAAPLRITIPRGTYVPAYEKMSAAPAPGGDVEADGSEETSSTPRHAGEETDEAIAQGELGSVIVVSKRVFWASLTVVLVMLAGILGLLVDAYITDHAREATPAQRLASAQPEIPVRLASSSLPSVSLTADMPAEVRQVFEDAIPRFGSVVYRSDRSVTLDHPLADFYIKTVPSGRSSLNVQFYHRESGIMIGADHIPGGSSGAELADHVSRITSRFLPVGGAVYAFLESDNRLNPLTNCLVLASAYFNDQNSERHRAAFDCHKALLDDGIKSALSYAELASLTVETITDRYAYPPDASIDDAITLARRAVELAPLSAHVHRALARTMLVSGERQAALQGIRGAHSFNPYDLGIAASYGNTLVAVGDFELATSVLERAAKAAPVHPSWWDYALFMAAFQTDRTDLVSMSARHLANHDRAHYCAARLIAAHMEGNEAAKKKLLTDMANHDNAWIRDPLTFYSRLMPEAAAAKLVSALDAAGLDIRGTNGG